MVESYRDQDLAKLFFVPVQEDQIDLHAELPVASIKLTDKEKLSIDKFHRYFFGRKETPCIGCKIDANKALTAYAFNIHKDSSPINQKELAQDLMGLGRLVHVSHTGVRVAATASVSEIAIEKMADEIQKFIAAGKLTPQEVEMLPVHGLDPKVIDRWKQKYASIKEKPKTGLTCCKCKEYYPYADAANQPDGSFKCYGCRV